MPHSVTPRGARTTASNVAFAVVLAGAAFATACAHLARNASTAAPTSIRADTAPPAAAVPLRIESHTSSDVVIYVGRGHMHQRLGTVTGSTTHTLSIPGRFVADPGGLYLIAHRVGGGAGTDLTSPTVYVQPGQTVVWTLESTLAHSALSVE